MTLFFFLTVLQAIIAGALVLVVLMQRSEGGGLGIGGGGSPGGLMSARGAADFLTRTTKWLAILFVALSIVLAALAVSATSGSAIDESLDRTVVPASNAGLIPLEDGEVVQAAPDAAPDVAPAAAPADNDPLAGVAD